MNRNKNMLKAKPESRISKIAKKITAMWTAATTALLMMSVSVSAKTGSLSGDDAKGFFDDASDALGTVIILIGAGVGVWGVVNLLEGYGNDNPGAKSQGMKQFVAGVGIVIIGVVVPGALQDLFGKAI